MSNGTSSASPQSQQNYQTKENYVTVLAIYDDPAPSDGIVEITNLEKPPSNGLKVSADLDTQVHKSIVSITRTSDGRSSITIPKSHSEMSSIARTQARKSRFTDAYHDAQERIAAKAASQPELQCVPGSRCKAFTVTLLSETAGSPLGIEISTVPDPNDSRGVKLLAVEVRQIDDDGRVAQEGTVKVGDLITAINNRPVYQMSLAKAQAHLRELQSVANPQLVINRRIKSPRIEKERSTSVARPVAAELQMANTNKLGDTSIVTLVKQSDGFGFGVRSRVNAKNESLVYINKVIPDGPAYSKLKIGDRLLQINDVDVVSHSQKEVVVLLKDIPVGGEVVLHLSRLVEESKQKDEQPNDAVDYAAPEEAPSSPTTLSAVCHKRRQSAFVDVGDDDVEYLTLDVALLNSKSAGLGISLKGGKLYPERGTLEDGVDCGLFVNTILHGSAAFKDGRFRENDRLIGIENIDLRNYQHNADALAGFLRALSTIAGTIVRIRIARAKNLLNTPAVQRKDVPKRVQIARSGSESEASIAPDPDIFNRENPSRKSISEKRPFGVGNEAINTQTFQKIMHQRQTSAPQIRSETFEKLPIPELKRRQASLTFAKKKLLTTIPINAEPDENQSPVPETKPHKRSSISQLFSHFRSGSKKEKARRQTIVISEVSELGQKPRSQSHDPRLLAKEKKMIHEVVADGKYESVNSKRRKKIEPAPSFKQAMINNVPHPSFDSLVASEMGAEAMGQLKIQGHENQNRKSIGNSLPRRGDPPPYNGVHRQAPQQYSAFNREFEHQRMHSAHEYSPKRPDSRFFYEQHKYQGEPGADDCIVQYSKTVREHGPNMYHIFHPTSAYVSPAPFQQQHDNVHQRQLHELQQRERMAERLQPATPEVSPHAAESPADPSANYYDIFNAWFAHSGRQQPPASSDFVPRRRKEELPGPPLTAAKYRSSHLFRDDYGSPSRQKYIATPVNAVDKHLRTSPVGQRIHKPPTLGPSAPSAFTPFSSSYNVYHSDRL